MPPTGAAAAPAAASSTASLAPVPPSELNKHDRVRVKCNSAEQSDDGTVTDTTVKLEGKTSLSGAFVAYDDGCRNWHFNGDNVTIWRLSAVAAPPPPQAAPSPPSVSTSDGGGGGSAPRCPICLEDLAPLGVVTLPCTHTVCVGCTSTLVNLSPTFQSQQEHNRDHDLAVPRVPRALQPA